MKPPLQVSVVHPGPEPVQEQLDALMQLIYGLDADIERMERRLDAIERAIMAAVQSWNER